MRSAALACLLVAACESPVYIQTSSTPAVTIIATHLERQGNRVIFTGEARNNSDVAVHAVRVRATVTDAVGEGVGTGEVTIGVIDPGRQGSFRIVVAGVDEAEIRHRVEVVSFED